MSGRPCPRTPARGGGPGATPRVPGLTRSQQLRQAKSAAFVKETEEREARARADRSGGPCRKPPVPRMSKGPPPAEPRRVSMNKPGLTKAVLARMKHTEKFKKELEQKSKASEKRPRRTQAPVGGDARFGRVATRPPAAQPPREPEPWAPQGALQEAAAKSATIQKLLKMKEQRMAQMKAREECKRKQQEEAAGGAGPSGAGPSGRRMPAPLAHSSMKQGRGKPTAGRMPVTPIPEETCELARSMNAEVVQVEPMGDGPIESIVIPPGTVNDCRTTIVSLPHTSGQEHTSGNASAASNRSMQILNESLDVQDAAESAAVNNKLTELQQARREFVLAVANVGGNSVNINEEGGNDAGPCPSPVRAPIAPPSPPRRGLYKVPDVSDEMFKLEYDRDHPSILAAREFAAKSKAAMRERQDQMRIEKEFARVARQASAGLNLDVPIEQEIMEGDISFEEDEETGMIMPCQSRIRASMPPIPQRATTTPPESINVAEIERFFNVSKYPPPAPDPNAAPPGRQSLNPDLWELEDPWYKECPPPSDPDLIDFSGF